MDILLSDLDLNGIKLINEPSSGGIIYYDHPSLKITGLTGEGLDTKFSNTLPAAIKIDTRGDPVNYQTADYKIPIKINNNPLNINTTNQTIDSYFSLVEVNKHITELKILLKNSINKKV